MNSKTGKTREVVMPKKVQRGTLYFPVPDSRVILVIPENGKEFTYEELNAAVGGYIESVVPANKRTKLWVNEEGLIHGLPPNMHTQTVTDYKAYQQSPLYGPGWLAVGRMLSTYRITEEEKAEDKARVTIKGALGEVQS